MRASPRVDAAFLKRFPYFAQLSEAQLEAILPFFVVRRYERGEILFHEGDPCEGMYFVRSGRVRVFKSSPDAREQVLLLAGEGESFNEVPNFDDGPNPASADALEPTTVVLLPKTTLLKLTDRYPSLGLAMLRQFAVRLRHLTSIVEDLSFKHVTSRLAKILLQYGVDADRDTGGPAEGTRRRLTQQEMAAMIGTAREMVSRSLRTLEARGAIKVDRQRIVILDRDLLEDLA